MLDRPGWGLSTPLDYSSVDYASAVADILQGALDALQIERADVVGASIGDVWALRLASRHPARIGRVAMLGGGPIVAEDGVPGIIRLIASPIGALMVRLPQKPGRVRAIMRQTGHAASLDAGRIPDEYIRWRVAFERGTDSMRNERDMVGHHRAGAVVAGAEGTVVAHGAAALTSVLARPPPRVEVPGDGISPSPGYYRCAEAAGWVAGEDAEAWWYDWVPAEGSGLHRARGGPRGHRLAS